MAKLSSGSIIEMFQAASRNQNTITPQQASSCLSAFKEFSDQEKADVIRRLSECGYPLSDIVRFFDYKSTLPVTKGRGAQDHLNDLFREFLEEFEPHFPRPATSKVEKVIVCSDTHSPNEHMEYIRQMIKTESKDTDLAVLAGDITDQAAVSRWPKANDTPRLMDSLRHARATIKMFSENFPKVIVIDGNHDLRVAKRFAALFNNEPDIREYLLEYCPDIMKTTQLLCSGFSNVEVAPRISAEDAVYGFIYQIGDFVIGHPEVSSGIPNKSVDRFINWLNGVAVPHGLVEPFRVAAMGHTHHYGETTHNGGYLGIELGCLCKIPDYAGDASLRSGLRPITRGYLRAFMSGNKYDFNASKYIRLSTV